MIISNSRRYIFIHVPKAAGTSVSNALDETLGWNDIILGGTCYGEAVQPLFRKRFGLHKHSRAIEIREVVGSRVWEEHFTFSFVRHPYSRAASHYGYIKRLIRDASGQKSTRFRRRLTRLLPLRAPSAPFWRWPATRAVLATRSFSQFIRHPAFMGAPIARPQVDWLVDGEGRQIVDFVGKVENLQADFAHIATQVGLSECPIGHDNRSRHVAWSELFKDPADFDYLARIYARDFMELNYDTAFRG